MKPLVILLALSTVGFAASTAWLLWSRPHEHARAAAESDASLREQNRKLLAERQTLEDTVQALRRAQPAHAREDIGAARGALPPATPPAAASTSRPGVRIRSYLPFTLAPKHRRNLLRQRFGALFHELALSEPQIEALLDTLYDQEDRGLLEPQFTASASPNVTPADSELARREIEALLGSEKAAQFENLKKTLPARREIMMLRNQLEQAGAPLSEQQQKQLLTALSAKEPYTMPKLEPGATPDPELFRAYMRERSRRTLEDASPVLTAEQVARTEESDAVMEAMQVTVGSDPAPASSAAAGSPAPAPRPAP